MGIHGSTAPATSEHTFDVRSSSIIRDVRSPSVCVPSPDAVSSATSAGGDLLPLTLPFAVVSSATAVESGSRWMLIHGFATSFGFLGWTATTTGAGDTLAVLRFTCTFWVLSSEVRDATLMAGALALIWAHPVCFYLRAASLLSIAFMRTIDIL